jgi:hypothetical protein
MCFADYDLKNTSNLPIMIRKNQKGRQNATSFCFRSLNQNLLGLVILLQTTT